MSAAGASDRSRWLLVAAAAAAMGAAGTYQFLWSSLSGAVAARVPASETALGTVFTAFVVAQTVVQLPAGGFRDRYGPGRLLPAAGVLLFAGFAGVGVATTYPVLVGSYALGGVGSGVAYTVAINTPVKWFGPDERRGLATGAVTMSYAAISAATIPLLGWGLDWSFTGTLVGLGIVLGGAGVLAGLVIRDPDVESGDADDGSTTPDGPDDGDDPAPGPVVGWRTAARTWQFWVLYAVMVVVNGVGLMIIGRSVGLTGALGLPATVGTVVASVVAAADSAGVLVVGGLSDRFGGVRTLAASLLVAGGSLAGAILAGGAGLAPAFVLLLGGAAFLRSPAFSIVPALVGSYYGVARSSENYGVIYTAKMFGGVAGGTVAAAAVAAVGWSTAFLVGAGLLSAAGVLVALLRPVDAAGLGREDADGGESDPDPEPTGA